MKRKMTPDEQDRLCVAAKKQAGERIKEYYAALGWVLNEQKDDAKYEDTEILYFNRPHFIADKDDLQLLQVLKRFIKVRNKTEE